MALDSYSALQASIASWLNREDLTSQIPDFISLAEARFNRELRHNAMLQRDTTTATADYIDLPLDWLEVVSITPTGDGSVKEPLTYVSNNEFNRIRLQNPTGSWRYYTIQDNKIVLLPEMASGSVSLEMFYYGKIPALSDTNTSNWLLERAPDLYLYGSLLSAEAYLQNDERLPIWASTMQDIIAKMTVEGERAKRSQGALATRRRTFG